MFTHDAPEKHGLLLQGRITAEIDQCLAYQFHNLGRPGGGADATVLLVIAVDAGPVPKVLAVPVQFVTSSAMWPSNLVLTDNARAIDNGGGHGASAVALVALPAFPGLIQVRGRRRRVGGCGRCCRRGCGGRGRGRGSSSSTAVWTFVNVSKKKKKNHTSFSSYRQPTARVTRQVAVVISPAGLRAISGTACGTEGIRGSIG